jgi:glutamine amidotransferase-like uncharacterized protein
MKALFAAGILALCSVTTVWSQFTNSSSLLTQTFNSGGVTGVTDLNNDGLDDLVIMHQSRNLYVGYQQPDGSFDFHFIAAVSQDSQWGMCVGDIDNDGHKDVMCGGSYDDVKVVNINSPTDLEVLTPQNVGIFMQACNFGDINNDGWLDGFACHDDGASHRFRNNGSGSFINGNDLFDYNVYPQSDMSGNYGSEFSDFDRDGDLDLMVAKCRQFVNDPFDPRRTNLVFVNDGNNNYEDQAHERGLVNLQQSWTSNFADVDNDGDFDCFITTHSGTLELYENVGGGYFENRSVSSGVSEFSEFFLQSKPFDYDNDGFIDLLYGGGGSALLRNNGDWTFSEVPNPFPAIPNSGFHGFAIGDLNHDGWQDVFSNFGTSYVTPNNNQPDRIYMNNGGSNHWIAFDLEGTISNMDAVGAIVEIYGPWGVQVREVRAGESYGITNTFHAMFGIGANTSIDYAVIHWPAGGMQVIENPPIDMYHEFVEGDCEAPTATIQADDAPALCDGQSVTLSLVSAGDEFLWNTGSVENSITVTSAGSYSVYVYNAETTCAAQSNVILVETVETPVPTITASNDLEICEGETLLLTASEGTAYNWSSGEDTQTISITESGDYSVAVNGLCGFVDSETVTVTILPAPAPEAVNVEIISGQTATLTATGTNINWYDSETSDTPIGTGNEFTTPAIIETTSFWVEEVHTYGGVEGQGGKLTNEAAPFGQFHNSSNFWNRFDALEDIFLNSVKVYAGNSGNRTVQLVNSDGTVLQELTVDIPQGESFVSLDFFVPAGTGYGLRTTNANPQLWRDRNLDVPTPFAFPYDLGGLASITGTTVTGADADNYYYFFYDWTVSTPLTECVSPREEVQVIAVGVDENELVREMNLFPNPATEEVMLNFNAYSGGHMMMRILDASGRVVHTSNVVAVSGANTYRVNVSAFSAGLYEIQLIQNGKSVSRRLAVN